MLHVMALLVTTKWVSALLEGELGLTCISLRDQSVTIDETATEIESEIEIENGGGRARPAIAARAPPVGSKT